ncbi:MAG: hypothetical protein LUG16_00915, partial [Candidatus Gastranaerophilales bacterium]|nr:hypothetical protein [Candidatus Gastranaerophilales bacterium]
LSSEGTKNVLNSVLEFAKTTDMNLKESELTKIKEAVKTACSLKNTEIAENKFSDVAEKSLEIIKNKNVNLSEETLKSLSKNIIENIEKEAKKSTIQVETKLKPFVDIVIQPFKFVMSAAKLPFKITSSAIKLAVSPIENKAKQAVLGEAELKNYEKLIHNAVVQIFGESKSNTGKISQTVFVNAIEQLNKKTLPYRNAEATLKEAIASGKSDAEIEKARQTLNTAKQKLMRYVNTAVENSFNGVTQSSNKNTDLAMMSKLASSTVTSAFLVADNYNMVMIKSNGEDKESAKETANERIIQRLSGLFYQALFINWFNATFRTTYNSSLKGMTAVVIPNTLTTEVLTRKSIGMPVGKKSFEELQANEEKNENRKGFIGKYFKFMRLLTGKKPLKDRMPKDKTVEVQKNTANTGSTNLLERYTK